MARPRESQPGVVRIIGGVHRGRRLAYSGEERTRPMKDRVREAVFNLLGPRVVGTHAIDLFAGTGALGLEALSRGARHVTLIERHFPTAALIRQNVAALGAEQQATVVASDTFVWTRRRPELGDNPWLVFCSPPYALYVDRPREMAELLGLLAERAPAGSTFVIESDERIDPAQIVNVGPWDVRHYPPAVVAIATRPQPQ